MPSPRPGPASKCRQAVGRRDGNSKRRPRHRRRQRPPNGSRRGRRWPSSVPGMVRGGRLRGGTQPDGQPVRPARRYRAGGAPCPCRFPSRHPASRRQVRWDPPRTDGTPHSLQHTIRRVCVPAGSDACVAVRVGPRAMGGVTGTRDGRRPGDLAWREQAIGHATECARGEVREFAGRPMSPCRRGRGRTRSRRLSAAGRRIAITDLPGRPGIEASPDRRCLA